MEEMLKKISICLILFFFAFGIGLSTGCKTENEEVVIPDPPGIPVGVSASDGAAVDFVSLEWTATLGATSYKIFRAMVVEGTTGEYSLRKENVEPVLQSDGTIATYVDNELSKGRIYSYKISAVNKGGESGLSVADTGYADALAPDLPLPPVSNTYLSTNNVPYHIYLDWGSVDGVTSYNLYRSGAPMGIYEKIATLTDLDSVDFNSILYAYHDDSTDISLWPDGQVEGEAYYYRISCINSEGEGPMGDIINGWFPYQIPTGIPANVAATDGEFTNKVVVAWDEVVEANSYVIYRAVKDGTNPCPAKGSGDYQSGGRLVSGLSYDDTDVDGNLETVYCYTIRAKNQAGEGTEYSDIATGYASVATGTASPSSPADVDASDIETNQITVSWTRADEIATHYLVYRSEDALSGYSLVTTVADNAAGSGNDAHSWIDINGASNLITDKMFYYKIKAVVYDGGNPANAIVSESSFSNSDSGFTYPGIPDAPTVIASDDAYWNRIDVSWTASDKTVTYALYRKIGSGDYELLIEELDNSTLTYFDTSTEIEGVWNTDITYKVCGVNSNPASDHDEATALFGENIGSVELQAPSINSADTGIGKITTNWNTIPSDNTSGSIEYELYWKKESDGTWSGPEHIDHHDYNSGYSYEVTGLTVWGTKYNVYVVPVMSGHSGPQSNVTTTASW